MRKAKNKFARTTGHKLFAFLCFLYISIFGMPLLHAEGEEKPGKNEIFAMGTGTIVSGNLASAKESAISQALMKGVESYLVRRLGSRGVINNFKRLVQEIIPQAKEEIENFHILTEDQINNEYKVLVRLRINEKVIDEKLREAGIVLAEGPPIKVLFVVSEKRDGIVSYWWKDPEVHFALSRTELVLHNVFQKRGFSPVNRTLNIPESGYPEELRSSELEDTGALMLGRLFSADVVICGQTEIFDEKEISMTLKALDVKHGIHIGQGMQVERIKEGPEGNERVIEALEKIANYLAARLIPTIIRIAASDEDKVHHLEITLKGLNTYKHFRVFKAFLSEEVKGVKNVRQTRVRKNSMSIAIEFQGDTNRFLDRVLNHKNLPYPVGVHRTEEGEILLEIEQVTQQD